MKSHSTKKIWHKLLVSILLHFAWSVASFVQLIILQIVKLLIKMTLSN